MFTGIIEELGTIRAIRLLPASAQLIIKGQTVLEGSKTGDSIAVNGVCLTVTELRPDEFCADVMLETLTHTNLKDLHPRSSVNLERAATLQTRLGGHFVSGHIDDVGAIRSIHQAGIAQTFEIRAPAAVNRMIVAKGSIAVDGISLTVIDVFKDSFTVSLIPHTQSQTTLSLKAAGSTVNLETDILGKYVARLLSDAQPPPKKAALTPEFLSRHGYL